MTDFGRFLRNLRMKKIELLKDMAEKLGVTPSYLSAVEVGKRNIPQDWVIKIVDLYKLNIEEQKELEMAVIKTNASLTINIEKVEDLNLEDRVVFARKVFEVDENLLKRFKIILGEQDDK